MYGTTVTAAALAIVGFFLAGPASAKPEKIRGVREPIYHLYLQQYPQDPTKVVLGPEATAEEFEIGATIQSTETSLYVNIAPEAGASYRALEFGEAGDTSAWGLEGDTIITTQASSFGRQLNFLVCQLGGGYWEVFLQTGSDVPSGRQCSNYQTIHLPCLC